MMGRCRRSLMEGACRVSPESPTCRRCDKSGTSCKSGTPREQIPKGVRAQARGGEESEEESEDGGSDGGGGGRERSRGGRQVDSRAWSPCVNQLVRYTHLTRVDSRPPTFPPTTTTAFLSPRSAPHTMCSAGWMFRRPLGICSLGRPFIHLDCSTPLPFPPLCRQSPLIAPQCARTSVCPHPQVCPRARARRSTAIAIGMHGLPRRYPLAAARAPASPPASSPSAYPGVGFSRRFFSSGKLITHLVARWRRH